MTKYLAKKPGISKGNRARLKGALADNEDIKTDKNKSHFFQVIADGWIDDQDSSVEKFQWQGRVSPSSRLFRNTCVETYFNERVDRALEFDPSSTTATPTTLL